MIGLRVDDAIKLALREPALDHAGHRMVERNRKRLAEVAGWARAAGSPERTEAFSALSMRRYAAGEAIVAWIIEHGQVMGGVDVTLAADAAEIGYWLDEAAQHRGLASRAVTRLVDHVVLRRGARRVVMRIQPWNTASRAVAQRLGFAREGLLRSALDLGDHRADTELWGVVGSRWLDRRDVLSSGGPDFVLPVDDEIEMVLPHDWFVDAAAELRDRNLDRLRRWEAWAAEESRDAMAAWYESRIQAFGRHESLPGLVRRRGSDTDLFGSISATVTEAGTASVGYWVDDAAEGTGVATRAMTALIDEMTGSWGIRRLWLSTAVDNHRSRRLAEKLGFSVEAICPEYQVVGGVPRDCVIYGRVVEACTNQPAGTAGDMASL